MQTNGQRFELVELGTYSLIDANVNTVGRLTLLKPSLERTEKATSTRNSKDDAVELKKFVPFAGLEASMAFQRSEDDGDQALGTMFREFES